jgi:hemoglobin
MGFAVSWVIKRLEKMHHACPRYDLSRVVIQVETEPNSLYERVGGDEFFFSLVERFYAAVEHDPVLRPLYPADLEPPIRHLALFLIQYWGGPRTYSDERGHPRLRMRHVRFSIGNQERDAWLRHMLAAVEASSASPRDALALRDYFHAAAYSLVNQAQH